MMKDGYKNNSIVANYSQKLSSDLEFISNLRFSDTYKQYDKVDTATATHNEEEDSIQSSANFL